MRDNAEQFQPFAFQAAPRELGHVIHLVKQNLVQDYADDLDAFLLEERAVKRDFIDWFSNATLAHNDDLGLQDFCDLRVGKIKDRAHPGMARTFAEDKIFFPGHAIERLL